MEEDGGEVGVVAKAICPLSTLFFCLPLLDCGKEKLRYIPTAFWD
jgi:hypothetical protein